MHIATVLLALALPLIAKNPNFTAIKEDYQAKAAIVDKLDKIILLDLNIKNLSLEEAISKLMSSKSGVINYVIRKPAVAGVAKNDPFGNPPPQKDKLPKKLTLISKSLSFAKAIDKICQEAGHHWAISIDNRGIPTLVITPK